MKLPKNKNIMIALKSMCITLCVFLFAGAMFIAMNESRRSLNGRVISASLASDHFQVSIGDDMWVIKPDTEKLNCIVKWTKQHSGILPLPLQVLFFDTLFNSNTA